MYTQVYQPRNNHVFYQTQLPHLGLAPSAYVLLFFVSGFNVFKTDGRVRDNPPWARQTRRNPDAVAANTTVSCSLSNSLMHCLTLLSTRTIWLQDLSSHRHLALELDLRRPLPPCSTRPQGPLS
jgi:hypothetical protein